MLIKYTVMGSVILLMLGVGMGISFGQLLDAFKQFGIVLKGVLANFLIVPVLIYLILMVLPLSPGVKIGIMLMAAAPVAPMAPAFVSGAKGDVAFAVGLMVVVAILSVILTPLILALTLPQNEAGIELDKLQIVKTLVIVQLVPICIGMLIRQRIPVIAESLLRIVPRIGQVGLFVGVSLLLASQLEHILSISFMTYVVLTLLVLGCLLIGDRMLAGEPQDKQVTLAVSTAIRNIPVALLIATSSFPDSVVGPVTLVFSVFTMAFAVLYGKLKITGQLRH
jgi:BASS family bile acid:Na+ symporter